MIQDRIQRSFRHVPVSSQAEGPELFQEEEAMRFNSIILAAAATAGLSALSTAPATAMPVQSGFQAVTPTASVEQIGYYGDGYSYYYPRHEYHSQSYLS